MENVQKCTTKQRSIQNVTSLEMKRNVEHLFDLSKRYKDLAIRSAGGYFFIRRCAGGCGTRQRTESPLYHSQQILSSVFLKNFAQNFFLILCNLMDQDVENLLITFFILLITFIDNQIPV